MHQLIDSYAQNISDEKQAAVIDGSAAGTEKRYKVLFHDYQNPDALRRLAGKIKDHTLHHLDEYLPKAEAALLQNGAQVHFADSADDAKATILEILRSHEVTRLTKSKSMAAEEIHLNPYLIENGIECLESDLAIIDKRRPKANETEVMHLIGEVKGRTCLIVDDMVDTAGTLCKAADALKEQGATRVVSYCTHAVLSGNAIDNINNRVTFM